MSKATITPVGKHEIIYMNAEQLLTIKLEDAITVPGATEAISAFHAKVAWSQDADGKYLEEVRMIRDVVNQAAWKDFPKDVWDILAPEVGQWLMRQNISFNKKKLESVQ